MGKANKCNLEEDEILAEEMRKYPCLYDKADKGCKERDRKANAWKSVEEALGYEKGIFKTCALCYCYILMFYFG